MVKCVLGRAAASQRLFEVVEGDLPFVDLSLLIGTDVDEGVVLLDDREALMHWREGDSVRPEETDLVELLLLLLVNILGSLFSDVDLPSCVSSGERRCLEVLLLVVVDGDVSFRAFA
jgi:hypothetical protein